MVLSSLRWVWLHKCLIAKDVVSYNSLIEVEEEVEEEEEEEEDDNSASGELVTV